MKGTMTSAAGTTTGDAAGGGAWAGRPSRGIKHVLRGVRRRARRMLVVQKLGWVVAWVIAVGMGLGIIDFFIRWPGWMRGLILAACALGLVEMLRRSVLPAIRFKPTLTEVALRIERSQAGQDAGLRGVLASGLELGERQGGGKAELAGPMVDDAAERARRLDVPGVFTVKRTGRSVLEAAAAALVLVGVVAYSPMLAWIGTVRTLMPWVEASWPKRTAIADAVTADVHPLGTALAMRAVLLKGYASSSESSRPTVTLAYRLIGGGEPAADGGVGSGGGVIRRVLLTSQEKMAPGTRRAATQEERSLQEGEELPAEGLLYERLIEPAGELGASADRADMQLEYWFESDDDATAARRVLLVRPPVVERAVVTVEPPEYAEDVAGPNGGVRSATIAGPGVHDVVLHAGLAEATGETALSPAAAGTAGNAGVLAGSRVRMTLTMNKALPTPARDGGHVDESWLVRTLGRDLAAADAEVAVDGPTWTIDWTMPGGSEQGGAMVAPVRLVDGHGITAGEETAYRFAVVRDLPPTVSITRPEEDMSVLATAVVEVEAEARDDVGLSTLVIRRQQARRNPQTQSTQAEAIAEPAEMARREREADEPRRLVAGVRLDLSELKLEPGDELWLTAVASDVLGASAGADGVTSRVRTLRILSRQQLIEQVWADLGAVRRSAIRLEEEQAQLNRDLERAGRTEEAGLGEAEASRQARAQAGLTERIAGHRKAVARLAERLSENGLADESLDRVMDEAAAALARAGEKSVAASSALAEAGRADSDDASDKHEQQARAEAAARSADQAQQGVRDELASLIGMLDQGEDTWAMKRQIERALEAQRQLMERTKQAGQETVGKSASQLSEGEKQKLDQIAKDQQSTAQRTREAIEEMLKREESLRKSDPASAQAMGEAARSAQRQRVAEKMDDAAQNVEQNQTSRAQQSQQQAADALEEMLDTLEAGSKNRDEVLRRVLASLIESIKGLIARQEGELTELNNAIAEEREVEPLAPGMQRLHTSTLGVTDEANASPREAAAVAAALEQAGGAQASAMVTLRQEQPSGDDARTHETTSLERLNDALKAAEEADQRAEAREARRKRDELRKAYMDALKQQVSIRDGTTPMVGAEATRRTRQQVRLLGEEEAGLKATLDEVRASTTELSQARMFEFAHERLASHMSGAADVLAKGEATAAAVRAQDSAVRVLQSLVEALAPSRGEKDFRDQDPGSGGGQGGGQAGGAGSGVVPPLAEVKLLRAMQQEALDLTRQAEQLAKEGGPASAEGKQLAESVAALQEALAEQGKTLIEKMKQQQQGGGGADRGNGGGAGGQGGGS